MSENGNGDFRRGTDRAIDRIDGKLALFKEKLLNNKEAIDKGFEGINKRLDEKFEHDGKSFTELFKTHNKMSSVFTQLKIQWWGIGSILLILISIAIKAFV